ncbi:acetyl-CoA hydrolase/transferase family protein [Eubacterium barkeri]|uniref:4-hydroxybutyrate CoA-transferase n=1 Tax=Eubacterium barkeri TaxID=1528 RepID=A0A1H3JCB0_EUBBA|nr:acetyl-CoA hydrolase/transferase C-terminal domain-containing protein [Eubacterium barkeri]SDY37209.1 4-hydroxybutyrate CoA-transferase [Eubacterium barkeri]
MDWKEKYKDRIVTAQEAVAQIRSGDKIIFGDWLGEPRALVSALMDRAEDLQDVEIIHGMSPGPNTHLMPEMATHFHHTALFLGGASRKAYREGRIDFIGGTCFHQWPIMFEQNADLNPHWAFIQLSPPDENGMCSFGNSCCFTEPAARTAQHTIAQINENMPYVGGTQIHLDQLDYIVPYDEPLYTIGPSPSDPTTTKIAENVALLVENGATLQLGIGSLPDAVLRCLNKKKDLGIHSETLTESIMDLVNAGVVTNKCKTLHPGVCVGAQAAGSADFFKFMDHNPLFELYPVDYVNDPYIIGKNSKMTSINTCVAVDLLGQATAESVNGREFSGIGGQLDHVRGSQLSEGGKSILALSSTTKNDTISKITASHVPGTVITVSRYDIDYVVTEYGIAALKYKTVRQRAESLIAIAHPKFRETLTIEAKEMGLM